MSNLTLHLDDALITKLQARAGDRDLSEAIEAWLAELAESDDQSWFWSPAWQTAEREADEDIRLGRYEDFATMDDFIAALESERKSA